MYLPGLGLPAELETKHLLKQPLLQILLGFMVFV